MPIVNNHCTHTHTLCINTNFHIDINTGITTKHNKKQNNGETIDKNSSIHADMYIYARSLAILLTNTLIAQTISEPEDRVLSVERNILLTSLHSHHTPRKIERQLALRRRALEAKHDI